MNKVIKNLQGITLIEVMLVLVIAALLVVMSVRYFESAENSSQANTFAMKMQQYITNAENARTSTGVYPTSAIMESMLPGGANAWNMPWGGAGVYAENFGGFTITLTPVPPPAACALITAKFASNPKTTVTATCDVVTYDATK